jgi:hypothetical protein
MFRLRLRHTQVADAVKILVLDRRVPTPPCFKGGPLGYGAIVEITPGGTKSTFASGWTNADAGLAFNSYGDLFVANYSASGSITEYTPAGSQFTYATGLD